MFSAVTAGSVTNSNISRTVGTATPFLAKNCPKCNKSSRKKSKHRGWSKSTLCDTSMMCAAPSWYKMLYSLKSACTRRQSLYIRRTSTSRSPKSWRCLDSLKTASFSRGAALPSEPMNPITRTCDRSIFTSGTRRPASRRRIKFRISFSAQVCTIFRGFFFEYPLRHRQSPLTYRSRSLNTKMDVLYTFTARSSPVAVTAWYTFASLPVDMHPLISEKTPRDSILNRMSRVRGSKACSTVARSSLSFTMFPDLVFLRSASRTELLTFWPTDAPPKSPPLPPLKSTGPTRIFFCSLATSTSRRTTTSPFAIPPPPAAAASSSSSPAAAAAAAARAHRSGLVPRAAVRVRAPGRCREAASAASAASASAASAAAAAASRFPVLAHVERLERAHELVVAVVVVVVVVVVVDFRARVVELVHALAPSALAAAAVVVVVSGARRRGATSRLGVGVGVGVGAPRPAVVLLPVVVRVPARELGLPPRVLRLRLHRARRANLARAGGGVPSRAAAGVFYQIPTKNANATRARQNKLLGIRFRVRSRRPRRAQRARRAASSWTRPRWPPP